MRMRFYVSVVLAAVSALPALADDEFAFAGKWKIEAARTAPWADIKHPMITDDEHKYLGKIVTIHKDAMEGPDLLGCGQTQITVETIPFAGIFEGGLAEDPVNPAADYDEAKAKKLALDLGFSTEPVPTLFQGCSEIALHMRDASTLMFGLNDKIFELKKQ